MAKKKVNQRRDYSLGKTDEIVYEPSRIQRKMNFLILRGPGLIQKSVIEENDEIKKLAQARRFKVKLVQVKEEDEAMDWLKDANSWAGGVVYHPGSFTDQSEAIQKTIKKILIPVHFIKPNDEVSASDYLDGLKKLIDELPKK